jgi:hypothetical protein
LPALLKKKNFVKGKTPTFALILEKYEQMSGFLKNKYFFNEKSPNYILILE